jgi:hypothetical protein
MPRGARAGVGAGVECNFDSSYSGYELTPDDPPLFTTHVRNEPSFVAYLLQQIGVPLFSLLLLLTLVSGAESLFQSKATGRIIEAIVGIAVAVSIGFLGGAAVGRIVPSARSSGRWVWVVPALALLWAFFHDAFRTSPKDSFRELFFASQNGEAWWAFVLLTCPAISTLSYSVAMVWRSRLRTEERAGQG